jgi:hemolysin activation/secretion protein
MTTSWKKLRAAPPRIVRPVALATLLALAPVAVVTASTPAQPVVAKAGALPDEFVLLDELKGIVLLPRAELVQSGPFRAQPGLDASQVPLLPPDSAAVLAPAFLGQPVSYASLERITAAIRLTLQQFGYPFVAAYLPPQDITAGWVQIVVQLSVAAEPRVEGANYFSAAHYRTPLRQPVGQPINTADLKADLDWLNRNSFHQVTVVAEPGKEPGTTALVLRANERFPLRFTAGYNNTGSPVSAEDRVSAGFNWGNAFGLGHQLGYNFSASPDFSTSRAHSANYAFDLPWRHTVRLSGTYSDLTGRVAAPLSLSGRSWQTSLRYEIPLRAPAPNLTHTVSAGFDFKASNNNLEFARIPITDNLTHIAQFNVTYDVSRTDPRGRTDLGFAVFASPGGLTSRNRTTPFNLSRNGAKPDYAYATLNLSRTQRLPLGFTWSPRAQFQAASGNLLGSEQMSGGGSSSVRGYEEGEAYGDHGVLLSHELTLPAFTVAKHLGAKSPPDSLQLFAFQDYARLRSSHPLFGETPVELHSVGAGLRYQAGSHLSLNFTYGWQLRDSGLSRSGENSRGHLSAQLSF